ncbi:Amidohydrolase family protein [Pustulibacterium marinum]|uniref:Amidohydrolase family protein n=1 Tax=Pustulibacterium marinum TaxID=1224947 RepID=A0A1I7G0F1_9FLAO|nr:amidohydrolase family protein [Pustulibacterium marinum]SFU41801.1 Amidohydrolase family protein [Pustulibacterium marinum]
MLKIVKILGKLIASLLLLLIITVLVIIGIDSYRTGYLKTDAIDQAAHNSYVITHVNVIPMHKDTVYQNTSVYIKNGIIAHIADTISAPNVPTINANGKYLCPGLIDMHVHVWDTYELGLYLANGVTAVRNVWGMPMHLRMKEALRTNELIGPEFFTSGPKITGPEFIGDDNLQIFSPEEATEKVIDFKAKGYDFIKAYYGLPKDTYDAVITQAAKETMDIIAHPSQKVPYSYHFNPQIRSIEHAEDIVQQPLAYTLDTVALARVVDTFAQSTHTAFCPTLTVYNNIYQILQNDTILQMPKLGYMNPLIKKVDSQASFDRWYQTKQKDTGVVVRIKAQHDFHLKIVKELHDAGVPIICGTDAGIGITLPGFSLHRELAFYKAAGLSNYEVLKTATINASQTHSIMNHMGSIEEGKTANMLLLESNPLTDITTLQNPAMVFSKGRRINRETLETFETKAYDRNNLWVSALRYAENLIIEK